MSVLTGHNAGSAVCVWCYPGDSCTDCGSVHSRKPSCARQVTVDTTCSGAVAAVW